LRDEASVTDVGVARHGRSAEMVIDTTHSIEHRLTEAPPDRTLDAPVVVDGRLPAADDEVAVDAALAGRRRIGIGDEISFRADTGTSVTFTVTGLGFDFDDCFYPQCDPARSWVSGEGLRRLGGATFAVVGASLTDHARPSSIEERLTARFGSSLGFGTWADTRADLLTSSEFFAAFLGVFGVFVLAAAAIVIAATITARALAGRRQQGLAIASGATPGQLMVVLVLQHALLAAVGAALGWLASRILVPSIAVGPLVVTGGSTTVGIGSLLPVVSAAVFLVAALTMLPAWRATRVPALVALSDRPRTRPSRRASPAGRAGGGSHTVGPVTVALGVRGWCARPARAAGSILALAVALVACVVTVSIDHSMSQLLDNPDQLGDPWDVMLEPASGTDRDRLERSLGEDPEIAGWYSIVDSRATIDGERVHVQLLGGDPRSTASTLGAGRVPIAAGEAVVGFGLFDDMGWELGQVVPITSTGGTSSVAITGWYRETEDDGHVVRLRDMTGSELPRYEITAAGGTTGARLAARLAALGTVALNEPDASMVRPFRVAMIVMSALLAAVALAHVSATALATARRRTHEMSVLRAVGGTPSQSAAVAATGAVITALLAAAIALPLGWWLQGRLGDTITAAIGAGPGVSPSPPVAIVAALVIALVACSATIEIAAAARVRSSTAV
jgi:putative ABC transport system permease protein